MRKKRDCLFRAQNKNHVNYYTLDGARSYTPHQREKRQTPAVWPKRDRRLSQRARQPSSQPASLILIAHERVRTQQKEHAEQQENC